MWLVVEPAKLNEDGSEDDEIAEARIKVTERLANLLDKSKRNW